MPIKIPASLHPLLENEDNRWYIIQGIYFGFPECCIIDFCKRSCNEWQYTNEQQLVHDHTGFVPCKKCSNKILEGKETLESLLKNRICKIPFRRIIYN